MLRTILIVLIIICPIMGAYAQMLWEEHSISTDYDGAWGIYAVDMDGDNDIDVLSVAYETGNDLSWWENDGSSIFSRHVIDNFVYGAHGASAGDIDLDGDMDVVCAAFLSNAVFLYDNDGNMNFTLISIDANLGAASFVHLSDMDNDNDRDIVACGFTDGVVTWYENVTYPTFTRHDIDTSFAGCRFVHACDLDLDGDTDIIAVANVADQLTWYENNGNQVFAKHVLSWFYDAFWAKPYDIDSDGDIDILSCAYANNDISWWENNGFMYFDRHPIATDAHGIQTVEGADLDLDGDLDIIGALRHSDQISWWENENNSSFTKHIISSDFDYAVTVVPADIDQDNDIDILATAYIGDKIAWLDNLHFFIPGFAAGIITDEEQSPIESVYVNVLDGYYSCYSGIDGQYYLGLPEGTYDIVFQKSRYFDYTAPEISIATNETTIVNVTLIEAPYPCTSCVQGFVENRETVQIESVYVQAIGTSVNDYTSSSGWYILEHLAPGTYDISFSHPNYSDTIVSNITVVSGSGTQYDLLIESNSAIRGVLMDTDLGPLEGISVTIDDIALQCVTDSVGEYLLQGVVPGYYYDAVISDSFYVDTILSDIIVAVNETLFLDTVYLTPAVSVWYGNPDLSPISAPIGDTILIDVYVQTAPQLLIGFLHLPLGTDDQYIVGHHSESEGVLYYTLLDWDYAQFLPPDNLWPGGRHSQSLLGFYDIGGDPNPPLQCEVPTRVASFAFEVINDTSLIGDTVYCFSEGYNAANRLAMFGSINGIDAFLPFQYYSPIFFEEPSTGRCEYVVGDVNDSGDLNGLDVTFGVNYFKGGPQPPYECECTPGNIWHVSGDVNGSCNYNGLDITYAVAYFKGGPDPVPCSDCPPLE